MKRVIDYVAKTTQTSESNLVERIKFDIDFLWDECRSLIFYTTLDNYEKKYLMRFDLWHTHIRGGERPTLLSIGGCLQC